MEYVGPDARDRETLLEAAGALLRQGGLVAFPTETVYGLGGDALSPDAAKKIYEAKGRPSDNPLIVHISRLEDLPLLVEEGERGSRAMAVAAPLIERFWPGPLTLVFPKSGRVPSATTGGLDTVAVRLPGLALAREFISRAGGYVAAPSANRSGRPSPTRAAHVWEDMQGRIDMVLDGGHACDLGLESAVVDMSGATPLLLRAGSLDRRELERTLGRVLALDTGLEQGKPRAPGMKYRHYAPRGRMRLVCGRALAVAAYIQAEADRLRGEGQRVAILAPTEDLAAYQADILLDMGPVSDSGEAGRRLYAHLRSCDQAGADWIFAAWLWQEDMQGALGDRFRRASGGDLVYV